MKQTKHRISFLQAVLLLICVCCLGALFYEMVWLPGENQNQTRELKEEFPDPSGDSSLTEKSAGKEGGVQTVDLSRLRAQYPDVRGWLTILGTNIDYPVMQSSENEPEYYLRRDYKGEYDINGSLFLQWNCSLKEGMNQIIYGHNMNSGAMFGTLDRYQERDFRKNHRSVFFQTEDGMEEYMIAAVLLTDIHQFPFTKADFSDEASLQAYVDLARSQEVFKTGEDVAGCHRVLTLVTCAYTWDGARTVVIAVQ